MYVIGFFVDDVKSWRVWEDVIERERTVLPCKPSCCHVTMENCESRNPKFCPECGVKTCVIKEKVLEEIKKTELVGYKNDIFHSKKTNPCGCFDCLECIDCKDCLTCACKKCKIHSYCENNLLECGCRHYSDECIPGHCHRRPNNPGRNGCDFSDGCVEVCKYPDLSKNSSYDSSASYKNLKGYYLKSGFKLVYIEYRFCILYKVEKINEKIYATTKGVELDEEVFIFRKNVIHFAEQNGIEGTFEVKYLRI